MADNTLRHAVLLHARPLHKQLLRASAGLRSRRTPIYQCVAVQCDLFTSCSCLANSPQERYKDNWRAAMVGWSRINDIGLQIFSYVADRTVACDVMRLMHASNHLAYADFAGRDEIKLARRR